MELVLLVVGGFTYYIFKSMEPMSAQQAAYIAEVEGFEALNTQMADFNKQLEDMCLDNCTVCGKRSEFASKCEKSHTKAVEDMKREQARAAFKRQQEAWS